jgi:hypothetical protein
VATVPNPYDAVAGTKLTASALDLGLKAPLDWLLTGAPKCHVYDNTAISCVNNTETLLTFSGESYDNDSMHSTASLTSRIVFNTPGYYETNISVQWNGSGFTGANIHGRVNSAENVASGTQINNWVFGTTRTMTMKFTRLYAAADYIQFWILQITGGTISTTNGEYDTFCETRWVGN